MSREKSHEKIAIIGMAGRFPGAEHLAHFWQNIRGRRCSITSFDAVDAQAAGLNADIAKQANFVGAVGVLSGASQFDAQFFNYTEAEAELIDPQQRLFLQTCWHALENAGYAPRHIAERVGVFAGSGYSTYMLDSMANDRRHGATASSFRNLMGNDKDYLTTRVSYKLDLKGPSLSVNTACSTSLVAIHLACQSLLNGESDMALAGGVKVNSPQLLGHLHQEGAPFSRDASCRPFSDQAAGTPAGNGVGAVVLKRLDHALEDGDQIYSVILSSAVNNDGCDKVGYTAPSRAGQVQVIADALALADVEPESIGYVETHGTATELGDALEFAALNDVFGGSERKGYCALGGVKANIGHLDSAAGVASLIKASLALYHGMIPPGLYGEKTNAQLDFDNSAFYMSKEAEAWRTAEDLPRRAGVSSFGVGGTNAHVVMEQAPAPILRERASSETYLVPFSAQSSQQLATLVRQYSEFLREHPELALEDISFTNALGRCHYGYRCAFMAESTDDLIAQLENWLVSGWQGLQACRPASDMPVPVLPQLDDYEKHYLAGDNLDWSALFNGRQPRRVGLPGYPFLATSLYLGQGPDTDLILANRQLWQALKAAAEAVAEQEKSILKLEHFASSKADLELLSAAYMAQALTRLDAFTASDGRLSCDDFIRRFGIPNEFRQLCRRLLDGLAGQGFIEQDQHGYWEVEALDEAEMSALLARHQTHWQDFPAMATTFPRLGENLADILQRKVDAKEIYFERGDLSAALNVYEDLPTSRYYNTILRAVVHTLAAKAESPLRILEVGAGTGATAARVLDGLLDGSPGVIAEYRFTDVSTLFLQQAQVRFTDLEFMSYSLFDMTLSGQEQGLPAEHYDLIIAANAVHVAQDIAPVMRNLRQLLKPQGVLALYEITENSLHGDITTGLLLPPVEDEHLRGIAPFMSAQQWHQVAEQTGFLRNACLPAESSDAAVVGEHVLLYQAGTAPATCTSAGPTSRSLVDQAQESSPSSVSLTSAGAGEPENTPATLYAREWQALDTVSGHIAVSDTAGPDRPQQQWTYFIVRPAGELPAGQQALVDRITDKHAGSVTNFVLENTVLENTDSATNNAHITKDLVAALKQLSSPQNLCLLWCAGDLDTHQATDGQALQNSALLGCQRLLYLVEVTAELQWPSIGRSLLLTSGAQQLAQDADIHPVANLLEGFAQVIRRGHPELSLQCVDVGESSSIDIEDLLAVSSHEHHLAVRDKAIYAARLNPLSSADNALADDKPSPIAIKPSGVYWIVGGASGVGLTVAKYWAAQGAESIVLSSRSPEKPEALALQLTLRQQGCDLQLLAMDVSDLEQVRRAISEVLTQKGRLDGIVHSAVVGDWEDVAQSTDQRLKKIFDPKVAGAWNLHIAAQEYAPALDFMLLFSSAVSIAPVVGLPDYAAANQFCEALAQYRNLRSQPTLAVAWGSWLSTGAIADDPLRERLQKVGLRPLIETEALALLDQAMARAGQYPVLGALAMDWEQQLKQYSGQVPGFFQRLVATSSSVSAGADTAILSDLAHTPEDKREDQLKQYLRDKFAQLLRLNAADIADEDNLIQRGLDSLMFLEVASVIGRDLAIKITPKSLYEHFSVKAMAAHFLPLLDLENLSEQPLAERVQEQGIDFSRFLLAQADKLYEPFALTDMQHAYWIGRSADIELGNIAAHGYIELEGSGWDIEGLQQAWRTVINRHPMLRAVVNPDGRQQILEYVPDYNIHIEDLSRVEDAEARMLDIREEMSHQIRDTACWPLFDIRISLLDDAKMRLHFSLDNIVVDGRSLNIFLGEWVHYYLSPEKALRVPGLSFRDYVNAERRYHNSSEYQQRWAYWQQRLSTLPAAPALPLAMSPDNIVKPTFRRHGLRLELAQWQALKAQAQQRGLTLAGLLLTCYAEVLARWSSEPNFTLNLPTFNRLPLHPDVNNVIGEFTSILLVEVSRPSKASFLQRAKRIQEQMLTDIDLGGYVSGIALLRHLARETGNTRRAQMPVVFSSMFGLEKKEEEFDYDFSAIELFGEQKYAISQTPQVWLDNHIHEAKNGLNIYWDEVEGLFPDGLVAAMFEAYGELLSRLSGDATVWDAQVVVPLNDAQQAAWRDYNDSALTLAEEIPQLQLPLQLPHMHTPFQERACTTPDAVALICGDRHMSYGEVQARVTALASLLQLFDARPNQLIAIEMEKGREQVVAAKSVLEAGAAYVPIDACQLRQRILQLLEQTQCQLVLTQSRLLDVLNLPSALMVFDVDSQEPAAVGTPPLPPVQKLDDLAYVIFTSGSTGTPKGVMIDHRGAMNTLLDINRRFEVTASDRMLALSALNFDLSVYDIFGLLAAGGTIVMPEAGHERDPVYWAEQLIEHKVTLWNSVPILLQMLVEGVSQDQLAAIPLRQILLSGDWIPLSLPEQIGRCWSAAKICSLGGATEASVWSIFHEIDAVDPNWKSIPYGRPLANQQLYVLDEDGQARPEGVAGELFIGGVGLAKGYWKDQAKTQDRFITHAETGERLYKTGDLARLCADGWLEFLGRNDFQVKIRGHRIEPGEIETVLRKHAAVRDALVVATGGEREKSGLQAYVIPDTESTALFDTLSVDKGGVNKAWSQTIDALKSSSVEGTGLPGIEDIGALWQVLEALFANAAGVALAQLLERYRQNRYCHNKGSQHADSGAECFSLKELMSGGGIVPRYHHWLRRTLNVLVRHGYLHEVASGDEAVYRVVALPDRLDQAQWEAAKQLLNSTLGYDAAVINQINATLTGLSAILTEEGGASSLYLTDATESIYAHQFSNTHQHLLAATRAFTESCDHSQVLRILELGAGLGTATEELLPQLADLQASGLTIEYWFTDVSKLFFADAKAQFAQYDFIQFHLYDIDKPGLWQGIPEHHFDLVIASSVLHVAADIRATLADVQRRLRPGGALVAIEETRYHPWVDVGMGLQPGFERFLDYSLRPDHPLLEKQQWVDECLAQGFGQSIFHVAEQTWEAELGIALILAQAPASVNRFSDAALYRAARAELPDYMVPDHIIPLERWPLGATGKLDRKQLPRLDKGEQAREYSAPLSENEKALASAWQRLLGLEQVSRNDHFFELGGDSLIATRLNVQLNEAGLHLPLGQIFNEPVLYKQAALVQAADDTSLLVKLNDVESGVPILWLHAADGEVGAYQKLLDTLSLAQPCFGIRQDRRIQPPTIQRLAAHHVSMIAATFPVGEIQLAGFSFGGMLAYMVAEQLCARGYTVSHLLLIDSQFMTEDMSALSDQDWVQGFAKVFGFNKSLRKVQSLANASDCSIENMQDRLQQFKTQVGSLPYRPTLKLNVPISFIQLKGEFGASEHQLALWQQASQLPIRHHSTDGNHFDCFGKGLRELAQTVHTIMQSGASEPHSNADKPEEELQ